MYRSVAKSPHILPTEQILSDSKSDSQSGDVFSVYWISIHWYYTVFSLHVSCTLNSVVSSSVFRSLSFAHCRRIISTVPPAPSTAGSPAWSGIPRIPPLWPWAPKVVTYICGTLRCPRRKRLFKGWVPAWWPGLFYQIFEWPTARDVPQMKRCF